MKKALIVLVIISYLFSSCTPILKVMYGIKNPERVVSKEYVMKYAQNISMDTNDVFFVASKKEQNHLLIQKDIPTLEIYNKDGLFIQYKPDSVRCNSSAFNLTDSICTINFSHIDTSYGRSLNNITRHLYNYNNLSYLSSDSGYDYVVVIFWGTFAGKLNKDHVKVWSESLNKQKQNNCRLKIVNISLDVVGGITHQSKSDDTSAYRH